MIDKYLYKIITELLGENYVKEYADNFSTRILVQKSLYLMIHSKIRTSNTLPYKWSFYVRGPYSSDIAHMLYHINRVGIEVDLNSIEINREDIAAIKNFKDFKEKIKTIKKNTVFQQLAEVDVYEALSTITYISKQIGQDVAQLREKFKQLKPVIGEEISETGFNSLYSLLEENHYV